MKLSGISAALILAALFALLYLAPANSALWQPDETRYAEISREMTQSGDWVVPRYLGNRYFEKPAAGYWINSISQLMFGRNNFGARFGVAFSTGASAMLIFSLALLMWKRRDTAFFASLIFLTMIFVLGTGTYATLDPMLCMWLTTAMLCSYLALKPDTPKAKTFVYALLGLACGMAFMTKGFIALAFVVVAVFPAAIQQKRLADLFLYGPVAVLAAILLCIPWSVAIALREPDFWNHFFWVENISRFTQGDTSHKVPFWFYPPCFIAACLPWVGLLPGALTQGFKERALRPELFFLLCWLVMPLLLLTAAKGKVITYMLPCMPPAALLLAFYAQGSAVDGKLKSFTANGFINLALGLAGMVAAAAALAAMFVFNKSVYGPGEWPKLLLAAACFGSWGFFGFVSLRDKSRLWFLAALCPLVAALLYNACLPDSIASVKLPQRFIEMHKNEFAQSRYVLANKEGVAAALAFELDRDDILTLGVVGELQYGLDYPDSRKLYIKREDFPDWLEKHRKEGDVALLMISEKNGGVPEYLPQPDTASQTARCIMIIYKSP